LCAGEWKFYFENESLGAEVGFLDDSANGDWIFYFDNGEV